jgi:hypothetical protein
VDPVVVACWRTSWSPPSCVAAWATPADVVPEPVAEAAFSWSPAVLEPVALICTKAFWPYACAARLVSEAAASTCASWLADCVPVGACA